MMHASDLLLDTLRLQPSRSAAELRRAWSLARPDGLAPLVAFEGCSLWLYRRLTDLDTFDDVDPTFAGWLARSARRIAARNLLVDAQRDAVVDLLNERECPHVLLKGAARRLLTDLYPYADARPTGDVDVLLPEHRALAVWSGLREKGFAPVAPEARYAAHHHLTPLSDHRGIPVELHTSTSRTLPAPEAWTRMTTDAHLVVRDGRTTTVSGATELLWHALVHALNEPTTAFNLRLLLDAAVIGAGRQDVDWARVAARLASGEVSDPGLARRWLGTAAWLAGRALPPQVIGTEAPFELHRVLRWRLSVCRVLAPGPELRSRAPAGRLRRLLLDEGTRASLGLSIAAASATRWAAAGAARLCFRTWALVN